MKKTIAALAASTAIAVAVVFAPAAGAQGPVGGCPSGDGWSLVGLDETLDIDVGNFHDQNGDGFVCQARQSRAVDEERRGRRGQ